MASIAFPPVLPSLTGGAGPLRPEAVAAIAPAALLTDGGDAAGALPSLLPSLPQSAAPAPAGTDALADSAAMRPDQVFLARQLAFPQADGPGLARGWRALVRQHGAQLAARQIQSDGGRLGPALLAAAQGGQPVAPALQGALPPDAWRFTVHAGASGTQHLQVLADEPDAPPGRRRRPRGGLLLELALADGTLVAVQVEPTPQGAVVILYGPDAAAVGQLRALQPLLEAALLRCGLSVLRWSFREHLPAQQPHLSAASAQQAAQALSPDVFRMLAELALAMPALPAGEPSA